MGSERVGSAPNMENVLWWLLKVGKFLHDTG